MKPSSGSGRRNRSRTKGFSNHDSHALRSRSRPGVIQPPVTPMVLVDLAASDAAVHGVDDSRDGSATAHSLRQRLYPDHRLDIGALRRKGLTASQARHRKPPRWPQRREVLAPSVSDILARTVGMRGSVAQGFRRLHWITTPQPHFRRSRYGPERNGALRIRHFLAASQRKTVRYCELRTGPKRGKLIDGETFDEEIGVDSVWQEITNGPIGSTNARTKSMIPSLRLSAEPSAISAASCFSVISMQNATGVMPVTTSRACG